MDSILQQMSYRKLNKKCDEVIFIHTNLLSDYLNQEIVECDLYINIWNQG